MFSKYNYDTFRTENKLRKIGRGLDRQLLGKNPDILVSPGTMQCAFLENPAPLVFWIDGTFRIMNGYYEYFSNFSPKMVYENERMELRALQRAAMIVCSSDWVRQSVIHDYGIPAERTVILPFGANFDSPPDRESVLEQIQRRKVAPRRILLVGAEWKRKGCDQAIQAVKRIRDTGLEVRLDIAGGAPPSGTKLPDFVTHHGFLDKATQEGKTKIHSLFMECSAFLLPTQAEAFGIVYCEAAGYGLPVVTYRTGGIPSVVDDGQTGLLVPLEQKVDGLVNALLELFRDDNVATAMSMHAHAKFEAELNWPVISRRFKSEVVDRILGQELSSTR